MNQTVLQSSSGRYRIEREYARGGMGITYLAVREPSGERCILKQLRMEKVSDWKVVQLFEREAEILRQLDHPNIPAYIDYFLSESNKHFNLVQAFIEGQTMQEWIDKRLPVAKEPFIRFLGQSLDILAYLHGLVPPVIHRDITPKNLILQKEQIYLVDFGSVKDAVNPASGRGSTVVGTFGYMPPEQFLGHAEPGSDLYSLGMSFIALASHKDPFQMVNPELGQVQITNELDVLPTHVKTLLLEMTEPSLPKRLKTASAAKQKLLHPQPVAAPAGERPLSAEDQAEMNKSRAALWIFIFLFSVMGLIAFFYSISDRHDNQVAVREPVKQADLEFKESRSIKSYAVSHSGKWIAISLAEDLVIRDAGKGEVIRQIRYDDDKFRKIRIDMFIGGIMFFTHDDRRLVMIPRFGNKAYWWDTEEWKMISTVKLPAGTMMDVKPASDRSFVSMWYDKKNNITSVLRCNENKPEKLYQLSVGAIALGTIDTIPEKIAFTGYADSVVTVYDLELNTPLRIFPLKDSLQSMQMDNGGKRLAWITGNEWVVNEILTDHVLLSENLEKESEGLRRNVQIRLSPGGMWFAYYEQSFFRSSLSVYSLENRQPVLTIYPDEQSMKMFGNDNNLRFFPNQKKIALPNYDRISIWNFEDEKEQ